MSFINDDIAKIGNLRNLIEDLSEIGGKKPNIQTEKPRFSIPLSKQEITAFEGLCAMEGKAVKDKIAELIKDYLEAKRKQIQK